jgi:hypothetical protein
MTTNIIRAEDFLKVAKHVKVDRKRRIVLPVSLVKEDVLYDIYANQDGQIILDPQVTIPASEAWVFQNPEILASLKKGLDDVKHGRVVKRGSFAKYVND